MTYRLIAADMDGTLLDSNSALSEPTKNAILRAVATGIVFTVSTGRPMRGAEIINRVLPVDMPFITMNGAAVVMGKSGRVLYEKNLLPQDAQQILRAGDRLGIPMMIWTRDQLYVKKIDRAAEEYKKISGVEPLRIDRLDRLLKRGIAKILWIDEIPAIEKYQKELSEKWAERINCHASRPNFLEFVDVRASKAIAMEKIGAHYGIDRNEMIAVGDGFNDISMLEYAGLGVAMANAPPPVKQKADFITLSNDEDGVAHLINRVLPQSAGGAWPDSAAGQHKKA